MVSIVLKTGEELNGLVHQDYEYKRNEGIFLLPENELQKVHYLYIPAESVSDFSFIEASIDNREEILKS